MGTGAIRYNMAPPVLKIIGEKLYWTLIILLPATLLSIVIGIFFGGLSWLEKWIQS
jgi:ABC-type dipeptide/oligopeptide/nickel transport system permease component